VQLADGCDARALKKNHMCAGVARCALLVAAQHSNCLACACVVATRLGRAPRSDARDAALYIQADTIAFSRQIFLGTSLQQVA
jgi:hypothetical protein